MRNIILFILGISLFQCCNSNVLNDNIIDEDTFVNVLVDIHMADATIIVKGLQINSDSTKIRLYYNNVFIKYGITQSQLQETFEFYSTKPHDFEELYEKVSANIAKLEEEYDEILIKE